MPRSSARAHVRVAVPLPNAVPQDEETLLAVLRGLRAADGRSIRELSADLDIPASTLGGFFSGRHIPTHQDTWRRLLGGFGLTDEAMVGAWAQAGRRLVVARRRRERSDDGGPAAVPD